MSIVNGHLRRQIGFHIFLVFAVTAIVDLMTSMLNEWSYGLQADYQWREAMWYVLMTLPGRLYELFPIITLVGCLSGLGGLANQSELTIIRATGISVGSIARRVLIPVGYLLILVTMMGELGLPSVEQYAQSYRSQLSESATSTRYGIWHREQSRFIFVASAKKNGELGAVNMIFIGSEGQPTKRLRAESGEFSGTGWLLENIETIEFQQDQLQIMNTDAYFWATDMTPKQLLNLSSAPSKMGLLELIRYQKYLHLQGINTDNYKLALWNKVLMPVMALSLVLVAVSFIFGPLRSVATGTRVFIGVMVGLVIKITQNILGPASLIFGFQPSMAALFPVAITLLLGLFLLSRVF